MAVVSVLFPPDGFSTTAQTANRQDPISTPEPSNPNNPRLAGKMCGDIVLGSPFTEAGVPFAPVGGVSNGELLKPPELEENWYNRIHFIPKSVSGGAIPGYKTEEVLVWNAYLNAETIYEIIDPSSTDGVSITGDFDFKRLEQKTHTVVFEADGDATVNSTFTYVFNAESPTLLVTGVRITFLPVWPQTPMTETLSAETWVFTSADGTEQRSRNRTNPHKRIKQQFLVTIDDWRKVQNLIAGQVGNRWAVVQAGEMQILSGASFAINDTTVTLRTDYSEFYPGGLVVLYNPTSGAYHLSTIESVDSNSLELETPFQAALSGDLWVAPVFVGKDNGKMRYRTDPAGNHTIEADFQIYEGAPDLTGQVEPESFGSYYYIGRENEGRNVSGEIFNQQYEVGSQYGLSTWGAEWSAAKSQISYKWTFQSPDDLWWFRLFFHEHQGNVPFWVPSFEKDLSLASDLGANSVTLTVTDDEYKDNGYLMRKNVRVVHPDGSYDLRSVDSVATVGSNTVITLNAATSNTSTETAADVEVQFLKLVRFAGRATIRHRSFKSEATFQVIEVQQ